LVIVGGLVLLYLKGNDIKKKVQESIEHGRITTMYNSLEEIQNKVFVDPNYCDKVKRLQDCSKKELREYIFKERFDMKWFRTGYLLEYFLQCSGMDETPLSKYFFTGS